MLSIHSWLREVGGGGGERLYVNIVKTLIASVENDPTLQNILSTAFLGAGDLKHHTLQPRDFVYWKRYPQKSSLQPHWKGPIRHC